MKVKQGFTFDDLLLVPRYSEILSRSQVDTSVDLGKGFKFKLPIVSANMKNVTGPKMAKTLAEMGGLPILHRFEDDDTRLKRVSELRDLPIGFSVGVGVEEQRFAERLIDKGAGIVCVDVAHGDHILTTNMIDTIASKYPEVLLIAGNVATARGAERLAEAGADVIKVGIGGGSLCTTRIETGNGVPQMTALMSVFDNASHFLVEDPNYGPTLRKDYSERKFKIIADGGIRRAGDCVKALCFADMVMMGSVLAGTEETPGECFLMENKLVKEYAGSSTHKANHIEGVKAIVPFKGKVETVIVKTMEGIRSGLSYQGVDNLEDLKKVAEFVQVTSAGLIESHPHIKG